MLLKEILNEYQGQQIKIGTDTSFLYCEICDENIWQTIQKISDERYEFICERLKNYAMYKNNFDKIWQEKQNKKIAFLKQKKANKFEILEALDRLKFEKAEDYKSICNRVKKYEKLKKQWIPFLEREVVEVYDAILYDCRIIRITGSEIGQYWDRDEYNAKNRTK